MDDTSTAASPRRSQLDAKNCVGLAWNDSILGLTAAEKSRVNSSLDTVFDAFAGEAA